MGINFLHIKGKMQKAIKKFEQLTCNWVFKFSVNRINTVLFSWKKVPAEMKLQMCELLEPVNVFRFFGILFDSTPR